MNNNNNFFPSNQMWDEKKVRVAHEMLYQMNRTSPQTTKQAPTQLDVTNALYQRLHDHSSNQMDHLQGNNIPRFYSNLSSVNNHRSPFQVPQRRMMLSNPMLSQQMIASNIRQRDIIDNGIYNQFPDPKLANYIINPSKQSFNGDNHSSIASPTVSSGFHRLNATTAEISSPVSSMPIRLSNLSFLQNINYLNQMSDLKTKALLQSKYALQQSLSSMTRDLVPKYDIKTDRSNLIKTIDLLTKNVCERSSKPTKSTKLIELVEGNEISEVRSWPMKKKCPKTILTNVSTTTFTETSDSSRSLTCSVSSKRSESAPCATVNLDKGKVSNDPNKSVEGKICSSLSFYLDDTDTETIPRKSSTPNTSLPPKKRTFSDVDRNVTENCAVNVRSKEIHKHKNIVKKRSPKISSDPMKNDSIAIKKFKGNPSQDIIFQSFNTRSIFANIPKTFLPMEKDFKSDDSGSDDDVIIIDCKNPKDNICLNNI